MIRLARSHQKIINPKFTARIVLKDEGIQNQVKEYSKNPTSAPLLTGLIVAVVSAAGIPIDPAIAIVIVLYILKVGINIFYEYIKPDDAT